MINIKNKCKMKENIMQNKENKIRKSVIDELDALLTEYKAQNERQLQEIRNWTEEICKPTYFLTIRLPIKQETDNFEDGKESLRKIMKRFEKNLLHRPWNKHHIPFVAFAELKSTWHYHILLNSSSFTQDDIENALFSYDMIGYEIDISPIQNKYATGIYCTKQLHLDIYSMMIMDTRRIITSYDLFNIPFKAKNNVDGG